MILKKHKAVIASILSAAMAASAIVPVAASAADSPAGTRTKAEKYGDDSYAQRFLSLYDDVITNGQENGYLSKNNVANGGFGVPYHAVEELVVEAPDYGHETTSEAMSYIVWMAAMRDNIAKTGSIKNPNGTTTEVDKSQDFAKAWKTMEIMIPSFQEGMMKQETPKATLSDEWEEPEMYNDAGNKMYDGNNGINPIHKYFKQSYGTDSGLYLMHWLADVDDWYGYGGGNGKFTFINTFQRGAQESCWETIPHPSIEEKKYGNSKTGIKGIFKTATEDVPAQWAYTNAPDAEDRAIQGVYAANRYGVGDSSITALAGKMGDQLRNNMFDKYYKKIGANDKWNMANDMSGAHYLMSWYTSWGGALNGDWTWQIGASHCHEFYQNPLAAFALLQDEGLKNGMKAQDAVKDYTTSLQRQMEYYLWLQSANGPIAGGSTSSWNGRYEKPEYKGEDVAHFGSSTPSTFYDMSYVEHPVYADPGSNHWIGNQVWAIQRLAEMYYVIKENGDTTGVTAGGLSLEDALKAILDRWVAWFVDGDPTDPESGVRLEEDGTFSIPSNLDWLGQPADWNGSYDPNANSKLTCTVTGRGSSDLGCVSSLCNTLIYYAKYHDVDPSAAYNANNDTLAGRALYTAHELLSREWELGRDDIGLSITEHNGSMKRLFEQEVFVPEYYEGDMPGTQGHIKNGIKFLDIRQDYLKNEKVQEFKAKYDEAKASGGDITAAMESVDLNYHRFWHAGDILLAMGTMYELYPEIDPNIHDGGEGPTPTDPTPTDPNPTDAPTDAPTDEATDTPVPTGDEKPAPTDKDLVDKAHWGDVNEDEKVNIADAVALSKYLVDSTANPVTKQGLVNANCQYDEYINGMDSTLIVNYSAMLAKYETLGPQKK